MDMSKGDRAIEPQGKRRGTVGRQFCLNRLRELTGEAVVIKIAALKQVRADQNEKTLPASAAPIVGGLFSDTIGGSIRTG